MNKKKTLLFVLAGFLGVATYGQGRQKDKAARAEERIKLAEENEPPFRNQSVFGLKLNTDGYGLSYEFGRYVSPRVTTLYMFELNEKLDPKEEKVTANPNSFSSNSQFKWGKANNFFQFKVGYGKQRLIGGKGNKNGVSVTGIYAGGLALGILKPYYIDAEDQRDGSQILYWFNDAPPEGGIKPLGASGITVGWGDVKFKPGAHAKAALRFDYGRFFESVSAIEAGINMEYYSSDILQMALYDSGTKGFFTRQKQFFFNAYITVLFGKRK